jgi:adenylate cyclase
VAAFQKQTKQSLITWSVLMTTALAVLLCLSLKTSVMQFLELGTYDWRVQLLDERFKKEDAERAKQYVVIDIDNPTFDQLKEKLGRWPWSRQVWTEVVRWVSKGKPKVIGVDIIFSGTESDDVDQQFARVMRKADNVVISYVLPRDIDVGTADPLEKARRLNQLVGNAPLGSFGEFIDPVKTVPNIPTPVIREAARGLGSINSTPSSDGAIRAVPVQINLGGKILASLPLEMANVAMGRDDYFTRDGRFAVRAGQRIPIDADGRMTLLWRNRQMEAARLPLWKVICSIYPDQCPEYKQEYTPEFFKDKVVLLGASLIASYDFHPTPLGDQSAGFIAHMSAVENIMRGEAVTPTPQWAQILIVVAMTAIGAAVLLSTTSTLGGLVSAIGAALLYVGFAVFSYMSSAHYWFPIAAPMIGFIGAFISTGLIRYQTTGRELRRTRGTLNRYVSPQLVDYVLENLDRINLAGDKRELSILFSDVRNFTTMTESADPMELIKTLNEYLSEMTDVIFKYDGITDKFIGDGILAYWGAFTPGKNHAELASRAALEMLERLAVLNERWKVEGRKELAIGIGINTGEVVFGNVGSGKKIEFTVIGDPVNLAARLESQTKEFGVCLIVSEYTAAKLNGDFQLRPLGGVKVKGKTVETKIFELQSVAGKAVAGVSNQ